MQEVGELVGNSEAVRGKKVPRMIKRLQNQLIETQQGRATALSYHVAFRDADHPARPRHTLVFLQEFPPIPGAQVASPKR